jgi:hypothetical protein
MKQYEDTEFDNSLKDLESNFMWKKKQDLKNQILTDIESLESNKRNKNSIRFTNRKKVNLTGKLVYSCITLIILFVLISGTAFVSPAFANTLKSIPVIGSIFATIGDKGLQEAEKSGLSISTNEEISVGDSTFMITDVIYDGSRLSIGYIITNFTSENPFDSALFKLNSEYFYGGAGGQGHYINKENYAGIYTLIVPNELNKDQIDLSITIKEFNGKEGNWVINIPISMIEGKSFLVTEQVSSKDYTITMKKVTFTPATTEINFDLAEPINSEELNQVIRFRLYDNNGNELNEISAGGGGCDVCKNIDGKITLDVSVQYEPLENIPDYLIIEPYISRTNEKIEELRMKIPLKSEK